MTRRRVLVALLVIRTLRRVRPVETVVALSERRALAGTGARLGTLAKKKEVSVLVEMRLKRTSKLPKRSRNV